MDWLWIVTLIVGLAVGGGVMYFVGHKRGYEKRRQVAEAAIS